MERDQAACYSHLVSARSSSTSSYTMSQSRVPRCIALFCHGRQKVYGRKLTSERTNYASGANSIWCNVLSMSSPSVSRSSVIRRVLATRSYNKELSHFSIWTTISLSSTTTYYFLCALYLSPLINSHTQHLNDPPSRQYRLIDQPYMGGSGGADVRRPGPASIFLQAQISRKTWSKQLLQANFSRAAQLKHPIY
jgi:hypothetical protein